MAHGLRSGYCRSATTTRSSRPRAPSCGPHTSRTCAQALSRRTRSRAGVRHRARVTRPPSLQIPLLQPLQHRAGAVADAHLGEDAGDVVLDRAFADAEGAGDLAVAVAAGHEAEHFGLALGEAVAGGDRL